MHPWRANLNVQPETDGWRYDKVLSHSVRCNVKVAARVRLRVSCAWITSDDHYLLSRVGASEDDKSQDEGSFAPGLAPKGRAVRPSQERRASLFDIDMKL